MKLLRFLFSRKPEKSVQPNTMKFLIAGLGNIGTEYEHTRHNIGFDVLDALAADKGAVFSSGRYGDVAEVRMKGKTLLLLKPSTYMNLSGKAVKYWMDKENITIDRVIVITDDLNLPVGKLRIRKKGSDGGHNGLKNINEVLASDQYVRVRFGVGNDFPKGTQVHYVLGRWNENERTTVAEAIKRAGDALVACVLEGADRAMNTFN